MGYGGLFGNAMGFISSPMGAATVGLAAVAGLVAHAVREHDQLAREVREASERFGTSSEAPAGSWRRASTRRTSPACSGLFPNSRRSRCTDSACSGSIRMRSRKCRSNGRFQEVNRAFEKTPNASNRALVAFDLFGRGGFQVLSTLQRMDEKIQMMGEHELIHPEDIERTSRRGIDPSRGRKTRSMTWA